MTKPTAGKIDEDGLQAVMRHFPAHAQQLRVMHSFDENFHAICADLAAAQHALRQTRELPARLRRKRSREYQTLVDELVGEIRDVLRTFKVTPLGRP
jgi:hypothetical protein